MQLSKVIKQINAGNYDNISKLNGNLKSILENLEYELDLQEFSVVRGNFLELPIKLACFLKHSSFAGMDLYENHLKVIDFSQIRGGTSGGGEIDILLKDDVNKKSLALSSKMKNYVTWANTELRTTILSMKVNYKEWNNKYGVCILDKSLLDSSNCQIEVIKEELKNDNIKIYDINSLAYYWRYVWNVFEQYDFDIKTIAEFNRTRTPIILYPHQLDAVNWFHKTQKTNDNLLLAHKPRAGKTVTTAAIIKNEKYNNIILLTFFPVLNTQWKNTFYTIKGFEKYNIYDVPVGESLDKIDFNEKNIVMVSIQGMDISKNKLRKLFQYKNWDLIVVDEVHYGKETKRSGKILSQLKHKKLLGLSATPTKNLVFGTFSKETTHVWTFLDEQEAKFGTHKLEIKYGEDERYGQYPNIHFYQYEVPDSIKKDILIDMESEEQFTFQKFFKLNETIKDRFFYDSSVKEFIKFLYGNNGKYDGSPLEFINPTISLVFLPSIKVQETLEKYLNNDSVISKDYAIESFNSKKYPNNATLLQKVDDFINSNEKPKKIILTVGQLKLGVTLSKCDCVMFMNDTKSPDDYIQMSYRCQSPSIELKKENCYVIDFLPYRQLQIIYDAAFNDSFRDKSESAQQVIERWFKCAKIFNITNGVFKEININNFLDMHRKINKLNFVNQLYKSSMLNMDSLSTYSKNEILNLQKLLKSVEEQDITVKMNDEIGDSDLSGGKHKKIERITGKKNNIDKDEKNNYIIKLQSILANIPWLCILSRLKYNGFNECLNGLNEQALKIYESIVGISKKNLLIIINRYKCFNLKDVDLAIELFNKTVNEDRNIITKLMNTNKASIKKFGDVFTPISLVNEMLDKLPKELWKNPDLKWLDNAMGTGNFLVCVYNRLFDGLKNEIKDEEKRRKHILENMIYGVELQEKYVFLAKLRLDLDEKYKLNLVCKDSLEFNYWGGMKFDVIIGNPPYQKPQDSNTNYNARGNSLWDNFVKLVFDSLLKENGYLCYVHPSRWRRPEDKLYPIISSKQLEYLEIHNWDDGVKLFGAQIHYDWYVLKNTKYKNKTIIKDEKGNKNLIDIRNWPFIPNYNFNKIKKILAKKNDEKCKIIRDSSYHTQRDWVKKEKNKKYQYPLVYSIDASEIPKLYYSSKINGHFKIPKIIFASGRINNNVFILDEDGKYGMTEFAKGIVDNPQNLKKLYKYMKTDEFIDLMYATTTSFKEFDYKVLKLFKKNFYEVK